MNGRSGMALPVALVAVLLGALLVTTSARWAVEEGKAGAAWRGRTVLELSTRSAVAAGLPEVAAQLQGAPVGTRVVLADSSGAGPVEIAATLLPDSLILLEATGRYGVAALRLGQVAPIAMDSTGPRVLLPLARYRPLP